MYVVMLIFPFLFYLSYKMASQIIHFDHHAIISNYPCCIILYIIIMLQWRLHTSCKHSLGDILVTNNLFINGYEYDYIASAHMHACSFVVFFLDQLLLYSFIIYIYNSSQEQIYASVWPEANVIRNTKSKTKAIGIHQDSLCRKYHIFRIFIN